MYDRQTEINRYSECYLRAKYAMGRGRKAGAERILAKLPRGTLLDVGAGRGELQSVATELGFDYFGVEPVPYLKQPRIQTGVATALPFADEYFDTVMCLDVLEHLVPDDVIPALYEMWRVCRRQLFLTASEQSSRSHHDGNELHISKRPRAEWETLFANTFADSLITPLGMIGVSPGWLITL